ncbi:efflux transporter outer membrane subunit [Undibacterium sp. Di26W]|uniref:efflux transporter outer membrane subunit n=1 Tax=Undibacterium sp. Di26W TaxID=3413035 RepID=UPI003BF24D88
MMKHLPISSLSMLIAVILLAGCASQTATPDNATVLTDMPSQWAAVDVESTAVANQATATWWQGFGSAELDSLMLQGLKNNPDLSMAAEHIVQAEAQARIAGASLFPVLEANAGASRRETHGNSKQSTSQTSTTTGDTGTNGTNGVTGTSGTDGGNTSLSLGLAASYEFDFWGKNAATRRAADSLQQASSYDRDTLRLTLVGGIATAYFQILAVRERLAVAQDNLAIARRVLQVVDARVRYGASGQLDLARQRAAVLTQEATIPPLQLQEQQGLYALAILLGQVPPGFQVAGDQLRQVSLPAAAAGLPASLLHRRPDLASAEAQLAAANANISAARAALFPSISLSTSLGIASDSLHGLLNAPVTSFNLAAGLTQTIFDGGRLRAQVNIAESRQRELLLAYRKAVLAALADVDTALAASHRMQLQESLLQAYLQETEQALHLSEIRYRAGADDLLVLLDAQRSRFQAQDQLTQIRLSRLQAQIGLFKALGGGWQGAQSGTR